MRNDCIPPLCDLLGAQDPRIIPVALNGLDNILRSGKEGLKTQVLTNMLSQLRNVKASVRFLFLLILFYTMGRGIFDVPPGFL